MAALIARPCEAVRFGLEERGVLAPGPGAKWALFAAILGSSMIFNDGTAVNVALPVLQRDLGASASSAQWVIEGYSLFLSALILIGGSLGDIFGRRLIYGIGIAVFTCASIACAIAQNIEVLVIARCAQGVGGALATPGSLALISASFSGEARGRAIGTWSAFSVIISAIGPVLGGYLAGAASWRWIFLMNVPIAAIVLTVLVLRVEESRDPTASRRIDGLGATLVTAALGALVFGLIRLQGGRLDPAGLACTALGVVLLAAFAFAEARVSSPMVPLSLFASRPFTIANLYTFLLYAALGGSLYFVPFDLIDVQGYSPAAAGAALLPMTLIMFVFSRYTGGLVARLGAGIPLVGGAALVALAFLGFALIGTGRSYWVAVFPATVCLGFGAALFVAPLTTLAMGAVEQTRAGVASGINNAVSRTAGLVAIALLGIALTAVSAPAIEQGLSRAPVTAATRSIVAAQFGQVIGGAPPAGISDSAQRAAVLRIVRLAYARGFSIVMLAAALLAACAALLALDPSLRARQAEPAAEVAPSAAGV